MDKIIDFVIEQIKLNPKLIPFVIIAAFGVFILKKIEFISSLIPRSKTKIKDLESVMNIEAIKNTKILQYLQESLEQETFYFTTGLSLNHEVLTAILKFREQHPDELSLSVVKKIHLNLKSYEGNLNINYGTLEKIKYFFGIIICVFLYLLSLACLILFILQKTNIFSALYLICFLFCFFLGTSFLEMLKNMKEALRIKSKFSL